MFTGSRLTCLAGMRRKFLIFSRLVWSPFETTFQDTLEKMKHHQRVVEFAFHLLNFEQMTKAEKKSRSYETKLRRKRFMMQKADDDARRSQEIIDSAGADDRRSALPIYIRIPHFG